MLLWAVEDPEVRDGNTDLGILAEKLASEGLFFVRKRVTNREFIFI